MPKMPYPANIRLASQMDRSEMHQSIQDLIGNLLDHHEIEIIEQALMEVARCAPDDAEVLHGLMDHLRQISGMIASQRNLRSPTSLGGQPRSEQSLIDHLCALDGLSGDLVLPLKATLSRTYLLTKIMFLRGFVKATAAHETESPDLGRLTRELREELAQSIYTLLAEELFLALLRKRGISAQTKRRAADQLISVWEDCTIEIDDFAPTLESAWHARNRITSHYGTLLGAAETFSLVCEDCNPVVLDYFSRDGRGIDESAAFEEFLFNMTSEELTILRRAMSEEKKTSATPAWAAAILGRQIEELEHSHEIDPMALYRSYQRRQLAADFRLMAGTPGPRRTAEAYLMISLLEPESEE
jgi:hypothetical protein